MVEGSAKDIKLLTRREVLKTLEPHGLYFILPLVCTIYTFITVLPLQAWRNNKCVIALLLAYRAIMVCMDAMLNFPILWGFFPIEY